MIYDVNVPKPFNHYSEFCNEEVKQFYDSGYKTAEVEFDKERSVRSVFETYKRAVKREGLSQKVKVLNRQKRVFLVRMEDNENE